MMASITVIGILIISPQAPLAMLGSSSSSSLLSFSFSCSFSFSFSCIKIPSVTLGAADNAGDQSGDLFFLGGGMLMVFRCRASSFSRLSSCSSVAWLAMLGMRRASSSTPTTASSSPPPSLNVVVPGANWLPRSAADLGMLRPEAPCGNTPAKRDLRQ